MNYRFYILSLVASQLLFWPNVTVPRDAIAQDNDAYAFDVPNFEEQAVSAGIVHTYSGPWEYFVGGGAASLDCNGDRLPDLFLAGGSEPAQLYVNRSDAGGQLSFEKKKLGLSDSELKKVLGAYPVDIDNDGHGDLVVLRLGENMLLKGGPNCTFTRANRKFAFDGGRAWTTSFSATWEKNQTFPTLAFGNYVDRSAPGSPWGTCHDNMLHRPNGASNPDYSEVSILSPGYCALSVLFTDWNRSGEPSLRVTNDRQYYRGGQEQLWSIPPGKPARQYNTRDGWKSVKIWGMGIAEADLDNDGRPEYVLTSMGDTKLQSLSEEAQEDSPEYTDVAFEKGATAHRPYTGNDFKPSTGWHTQFADFNNDGRTDLYIAKGNVEAMPDFAAYDPDNLLLGNELGGFTEKGDVAGIALDRRGRGAVVEDFNADGMLDLLVVNRMGPASLFRNLGSKVNWGYRPMGNWVSVELRNGDVNRYAIGARITVKTGNHSQTKTVQIGGGHASGQTGFVHFGVGVAERAGIRIQWPDGNWSHEYRVFANNYSVIERGKNEASYWYPTNQE